MKEINLPPFFVGQKVVALDNGIYLVKGNIYTVKGLSMCCNRWLVDVGWITPAARHTCSVCNKTLSTEGGIGWVLGSRLAPITENFQHIEYSKVLEEEKALISKN